MSHLSHIECNNSLKQIIGEIQHRCIQINLWQWTIEAIITQIYSIRTNQYCENHWSGMAAEIWLLEIFKNFILEEKVKN